MRRSISDLSRRCLLRGGGALALLLLLGAGGCGYFLHPERKDRTDGRNGEVRAPVMMIDLLWLVPGVAPGAICLVVDFDTGLICRGGPEVSRTRVSGDIEGRIATVTVVVDGTIVANGEVRSDHGAHLIWRARVEGETLKARGVLVLQRPDGAKAQAFVRDLI